jgi:preprotein translocase subunit SecB
MKAKFSPLEMERFELLESHYEFIVPKEEQLDLGELFKSYGVEIEFEHIYQDDDHVQLFVEIKVNRLKKPRSGYSLATYGMGIFKLSSQKVKDDLIGNLKNYSTLNMMINNLRNIMYQTTNLGPMGGYLLPPIDILDLFEKKQKEEEKKKEAST